MVQSGTGKSAPESGKKGRAESPGRARSANRHFRTEPSSAPLELGRGREPRSLAGFQSPVWTRFLHANRDPLRSKTLTASQAPDLAAIPTKRFCVGYGFRFVNGRY